MTDRTPAADDVLDLTDAEFHAKYGVTPDSHLEASTSHTILAAYAWPTNGDLIADVARLGYLRPTDLILDPTYGEGVFWRKWQPDRPLVASDIVRHKSPVGAAVDFLHLPWHTQTFDAVVFDPPYKLNGTPDPQTDRRYGVDVVATWQGRHQLIRDGIAECVRVLKHDGILLLKCQDQVCSGKIRWQTREFADHAETCGTELVDRFDFLGNHRPQPAGRRQVHAHGRPSTLLLFRKVRSAATQPGLFDSHLAGDIDDLLPPSRPTIDVACPILEDQT